MNNRKWYKILIVMSLINMTPPFIFIYLISQELAPMEAHHIPLYLSPLTVINGIVLLQAVEGRKKKAKKKR